MRVIWADEPGPFTAKLLFRVGAHDGLTLAPLRVVERAFWDVTRPAGESSAGRLFTSWQAEGDREEVLTHLELVAAVLAEMPYPTRGTERSPSFLDRLLHARFEAPAEIAGDGWFTRGNAAVWMSGEPPADFALPLPDGPRKPVAPIRPRAVPLRVEGGFAAVSAVADWSPATRVAVELLRARLGRALPWPALVAEGVATRLDIRLAHVFVGCHCPPRASRYVHERLQEVLAAPPTAPELADQREPAPRGLERLDHEARHALLGLPPRTDAAGVDAVAAVLEAVRDTALVLSPV
ncbi:hypothetical protein C8N24_4597 [Solirubrobacter pauli]|uniref:Uncharacterized protein n=1 Tax=Solirubrobacter pauli TaxID=166793 RepID=A0A660L042_9ACTN|nr:hypothetical protein [Solirubrobacter pauli]RKQ86584.1 hypothetical protein C8N24_4597 [Solirubrobacter pauli]